MANAIIPPALGKPSFTCPHCGANSHQTWFSVFVERMDKDKPPHTIDIEKAKIIIVDEEDPDARSDLENYVRAKTHNLPSVHISNNTHFLNEEVVNFYFSQCYSCGARAMWLLNNLIFPKNLDSPQANPDLPDEIRADYDEAGAILSLSPRGAAALLRLSIQKLCNYLEKKGTIDEMIAALVVEGLSTQVKQALDVVRVIGNEAVHPGTIDLKDDSATVLALFQLVNLIAEKMISEPKHVADMFASLPPNKLQGIEQRDRKALTAPTPPAATGEPE